MLDSISKDIWFGSDRKSIARNYENLKWVSFSALPRSEVGITAMSAFYETVNQSAYKWGDFASPGDGFVESAASVLPPDTGITEYIITTFGPHAMALGDYNGQVRVAPEFQNDEYRKIDPKSGQEILDAIIRAFPSNLLD